MHGENLLIYIGKWTNCQAFRYIFADIKDKKFFSAPGTPKVEKDGTLGVRHEGEYTGVIQNINRQTVKATAG